MEHILEVQERFSTEKAITFMQAYCHWSVYISVFYVASIFAIQKWMRDREKFDLRRPLFIWSLTLSLFSFYGYYRNGLVQLRYLYDYGWERATCDKYLTERGLGLWTFLFCFSKLPELADTYFIVLRKQKLIFLHWYHHITVFMYCWFQYAYMITPAQWFICMNYFVHAIMYLYYAVRALGHYRPPIWINMFITSLQLLQMIVGSYVNIYVYSRMSADPNWYCDGRAENSYVYVYVAFAMYFSYFVLFAHFFYTNYLRKSPRKDQHLSKKAVGSGTHLQNGITPGVYANGGTHSLQNGSIYSNGTIH